MSMVKKIGTLAQEKNQTPQEYVDGMAEYAKGLWKKMKIENDDFIRTTEERHTKVVEDIFEKLLTKETSTKVNMKAGIVYHVKHILQKHN